MYSTQTNDVKPSISTINYGPSDITDSTLKHDSDQSNTASREPVSVTWRTTDLLGMKAAGEELTEDQIQKLVKSITDNSMDNLQLGAFLMAVFVKGMTDAETAALTTAMKISGTVLKWPQEWTLGDKHSTGGVGDKVSLPLAPALAACGLKVPMISGRGLGHTGGTLDKLESIPGFNASLSQPQLLSALSRVGCVISGQTGDLVPADRRMYAARDVTGTVASTPLIVSSILSKKAAESLNALVLDVKFGCGGFMKTQADAEALAKALVGTMKVMGIPTTALVTNMENPIGRAIGNSLEVMEAIECLQGGGSADLRGLVTALGGELLTQSGISRSVSEGTALIDAALDDGSALRIFEEMLRAQGVSEKTSKALCGSPPSRSCLPAAPHTTEVLTLTTGVITKQNALAIAEVSLALGAGRNRAGDSILYDVGVYLNKVVGEHVQQGEPWATIHHRDSLVPGHLLHKMNSALTVNLQATSFSQPSRVFKTIRSD